MPDIRLVQRTDFPARTAVSVDWLLLNDGTLDETEALATAVIVALGTDRLADPEDELPDPDSTDRRGWWGDYQTQEIWGGWEIGCRLWLMQRAKITGAAALPGSTLVRIKHYIQEAIQPFLMLRIATSMDVEVVRTDTQRIDALVRLYRGPLTAVELRYQILWTGIITD
jgi:phage gp46-like protein